MKVTMFPRLHLQSAQKAMAALKAMGDCGVTRESSTQGTPFQKSRFSAFQTTQEPKSTDY